MTTFETIDLAALAAVSGGRSLQGEVCDRGQYNQMVKQMVPDHGPLRPGFERHVVESVAKICRYPMPGR